MCGSWFCAPSKSFVINSNVGIDSENFIITFQDRSSFKSFLIDRIPKFRSFRLIELIFSLLNLARFYFLNSILCLLHALSCEWIFAVHIFSKVTFDSKSRKYFWCFLQLASDEIKLNLIIYLQSISGDNYQNNFCLDFELTEIVNVQFWINRWTHFDWSLFFFAVVWGKFFNVLWSILWHIFEQIK